MSEDSDEDPESSETPGPRENTKKNPCINLFTKWSQFYEVPISGLSGGGLTDILFSGGDLVIKTHGSKGCRVSSGFLNLGLLRLGLLEFKGSGLRG